MGGFEHKRMFWGHQTAYWWPVKHRYGPLSSLSEKTCVILTSFGCAKPSIGAAVAETEGVEAFGEAQGGMFLSLIHI